MSIKLQKLRCREHWHVLGPGRRLQVDSEVFSVVDWESTGARRKRVVREPVGDSEDGFPYH